MQAIDALLDRLASYKVRQSAPGRWRAICPVCGERNPNTLSIGESDSGAVLLRCFKLGCSVDSIASALGVEVGDLFPPRPEPGRGAAPVRRRRLLSASQALQLLDEELTLAFVCMSDMARGELPDEGTRERLLLAAARVSMLRTEVAA